ncbi:MAG: hypothetical protein WBA23_00895, partial [Tunicatimonas sp.]|uniref:hypothetical protein n=1 Tax=Tunicatimonas sp. TaxID=1940096 RepID=UPI003C746AB7
MNTIQRTLQISSLVMIISCASGPLAHSQWVVTDFYNGVINTITQTINAAMQILDSEAFQFAVDVAEKVKEVHGGVKQISQIKDIGVGVASTAQKYAMIVEVLRKDPHIAASEVQFIQEGILSLKDRDTQLLEDLGDFLNTNLIEM